MILYGRDNSINVQKALFALRELGVDFELRPAGREHGVVGTPEYIAMNPNGTVPTLVDGHFVLWESNAIVRYLAQEYGHGTLWPAEREVRAIADQWLTWQAVTAWPVMQPAFWNLIRFPPEERDMAAVEKSVADTNRLMGILDAWLASRIFVAGESFTIGDVGVGAFTHRYFLMPFERPELPHLARYYKAVHARPAAEKTLLARIT